MTGEKAGLLSVTGERGRTSGMRGDSGLSGGKMLRRGAPQHDRGKGGASRHDRKGARGVRYAGGGYVWRPDRTSPPAPAAPMLRDIHRPLSLCRPTSAARPVILSEAKDLLGLLPVVCGGRCFVARLLSMTGERGRTSGMRGDSGLSGGKMLRREAPQHDRGKGGAPQRDRGEGQDVRHAGGFRPERREDASSRSSSA